ncbi:MAG: AAA family ATPase [Bacilli bacterium]|nr:AAA family ATPase [Bacilli bacterium]
MAYVYYDRVNKGLSLLFFDPENSQAGNADYDFILEILESYSRLDFSYNSQNSIFPITHHETDFEREERLHFDMDEWTLIAAEIDQYGTHQTAFICNKRDPERAFVLALDRGRIIAAIYQDWEVWSGPTLLYASQDYPWDSGIDDILAHKDAGKQTSYVHPSFAAYQKKKPKNLDTHSQKDIEEPDGAIEVERPSFVAGGSKKPKNLGDYRIKKPVSAPSLSETPKKQAKDSEPVIPPSFVPTSSKKPRNLDAISKEKPKEIEPKKEEEPEVVNIPKLEAYRPPVAKGRPKDLRHWSAKSAFTLMQPEGCFNLFYTPYKIEVVERFQEVAKSLENLTSLYIGEFCVFTPDFPDYDVDALPEIRTFDIKKWNPLVLTLGPEDEIQSVLIALKDDPRFCLVIRFSKKSRSVFAFLTSGASLAGSPLTTFDLVKRYQIPPVKPKPIEPKKETPTVIKPKAEPKVIPVIEKEEPPVEEHREKLIQRRKVFSTSSFQRDCEAFHDSYFGLFDEDLRHTLAVLLSTTEEELVDYLKRNDGKKIFDRGPVTVYKFRFGTSPQYAGARLFYCYGYDLPGTVSGDGLLLLGISPHEEHDDQYEFAENRYGRFLEHRDFVYQQFLPEGEDGGLEHVPHMSSDQFGLLGEAAVRMPMAFLGSAGTGKTLLSVRHGLEMGKQGKRVLYLTYQQRLCDMVTHQFELLDADNVETMTFRGLVGSILGPEAKDKMKTKRHFRDWFLHYAKHTYAMKRPLRAFGDALEDQFRVCYTFYRGVIDGVYEPGKTNVRALMSKERFFELTRDERGYSNAEKETIYEVGKAYQAVLEREDGFTDNQLASQIMALGSKGAPYDAIIVDEFQDLTELQFIAILNQIKPADPLPLFIYGDENQAINPTLFDFDDANRMLRMVFGQGVVFERQLIGSSYRSGPALVHYINDINRVKREAIGTRRYGDDEEISVREDDADLLPILVQGKERLKELVEACAETDRDVVFIFPSATLLEKCHEEFGKKAKNLVETRFLSVEDAKGMQWDSVVLVDFFSNSRKLFDGMLGEERLGHRSTIHRMLFNRFYVALTRAENRIIVYESDPSELIRRNLLSGLVSLADMSELHRYFEGKMRIGDWKKRGDEQFRLGRYDRAAFYYSRSSRPEAAEAREKAVAYLKASRGEMGEKEQVALYLENGDYASMLRLYQDGGKGLCERLLFALLNHGIEAKDALEAYRHLPKALSNKERVMFLDLCIGLYNHTIDDDIDRLKRRLADG